MGRSKAKIAADRAEIAKCLLQGDSERDIAEKLGVSQATVHRDKRAVYQAWKESQILPIDEAVARELRRIDEIEKEAWEAWRRSCRKVTRTQTKVKGVTAKRDDFSVSPKGELVKKERSRNIPLETERRVTEYERDGNPAWLKIISECSHRRIVLLRAAIGPEDDPVSLQAFFDAVGKASVSAWEGVTAPVWEDDDSEEGEDFDLWQD